MKVSGVAWHGDGFYYSRYPEPAEGPGEGLDQREPPGLLPQARHAAVAGHARLRGRAPIRSASTRRDTTEDERFAILDDLGSRQGQGRQRAVRARSLERRQREFTPLDPDDRRTTRSSVVDNVGDKLLVQTNTAAPNWPRRADRSRAAGGSELEDRARRAAGAAREREHGRRQAVRDLPEGRDDARLRLSASTASSRTKSRCRGPARAGGFGGDARRHVRLLHVQLAERAADDLSLRHRDARRARVFRAAEGARLRRRRRSRRKQVFYPSKDGTRIPMFLVHRKGLKLDGNNPTLLYGYGGFNVVAVADVQRARAWRCSSRASSTRRPTCAAAASTARRGTRQGMKLKKQNVFDDFIAAAEWLIAQQVHVARRARDPGRLERRPAGRRGDEPAAGAVPRRASRRSA